MRVKWTRFPASQRSFRQHLFVFKSISFSFPEHHLQHVAYRAIDLLCGRNVGKLGVSKENAMSRA